MTTIKEINDAITSLGIEGGSIIVHSSLRSFGELEGGTKGLIEVLRERFSNVMMPAFSTTFITRPPEGDRPAQNGCDYADESLWKLNTTEAFDFKKIKVDPRMGRIAQDFADMAGTFRSRHPWHGWSVSGKNAEEWTKDHSWAKTHTPLEKLIEAEGNVLLLGVGLRSCSALHIAEEKAGRKPFIRWSRNEKGEVERIRVSGCAKGFHFLEPFLKKTIQSVQVGRSSWSVARISELITESKKIICECPEITRCSKDCIKCEDAILGGVQE